MAGIDPLAGSAWSRPETVAGFVQSDANPVLLRRSLRRRQLASIQVGPERGVDRALSRHEALREVRIEVTPYTIGYPK